MIWPYPLNTLRPGQNVHHFTDDIFLSYLILSYSTTWWRHQMETLHVLLALRAGNSPVTGKFPSQRPVTWSFDVFFDLALNKRLSKPWRRWWFETPSRSLWRHSNDIALCCRLFTADFAAATILISFSAVLGRLSPLQGLVMALFEIVFFQVNEWLGLQHFRVSVSCVGFTRRNL